MLAALFLGYRRIWTWGWYAATLEKDRDMWRDLALGRLTSDADAAKAARSFVLAPDESTKAEKAVREAGRRE